MQNCAHLANGNKKKSMDNRLHRKFVAPEYVIAVVRLR